MVFRDMAIERNLTLPEFGEMALQNSEIDKELDRRIVAIAREKKKLVLEGRLAAHMLHLNGIKSFKVWIDADISTRADRISGREGKPQGYVMEEIRVRQKCEHDRYEKIYGIDLDSLAVYDHVVHSDNMTPEEIVDEIISIKEAKFNV
jgi:predicted cytidylate kinase